MSVLLAIDSPILATGLSNALRKLGYDKVAHVATAARALRHVEEADSVDFLLVGWDLDGASGLEFVRAVRSRPEGEETPIIMVSPYDDSDRVMRAILVGVDGYLIRPVSEKALAARIAQIFVRRRATAA